MKAPNKITPREQVPLQPDNPHAGDVNMWIMLFHKKQRQK